MLMCHINSLKKNCLQGITGSALNKPVDPLQAANISKLTTFLENQNTSKHNKS